MACENASNKISKVAAQISAGISQLSNKQAFYAGTAVGAMGASLGTLALAKRQAIGRTVNRLRGNDPQTDSGMAKRSIQSTGKQMKTRIPTSKPQPIPALAAAKQTRQLGKKKPSAVKTAQPIPALAARTQQTQLKAAPIQMQTGSGQTFTAQNSYQVLRTDGTDTGLAITPHMTQTGPDDSAWSVTHAGSGTLISGPYQNISQAQTLATRLAPLRWTAQPVPASDVAKAKNVVQAYRQSPEA